MHFWTILQKSPKFRPFSDHFPKKSEFGTKVRFSDLMGALLTIYDELTLIRLAGKGALEASEYPEHQVSHSKCECHYSMAGEYSQQDTSQS